MDVLAHGLWTNVMYKALPATRNDPKASWWGIAFGVLPDFASFTPIFTVFFTQLLSGNAQWVDGRPGFEAMPLQNLTSELYNYTHSFVVWALVTLVVWAIWKRFPWFLLGWALHVGIDIFSHSTEFYPTPFLFPISGVEVNGIPWSHPIFMAINYGLLFLIYLVIFPYVRKKKALPS